MRWPRGIGGKGNEGVATYVGYLPGAIGYIAWDFTKQNHLTYTAMTNATGAIVEPGAETFNAAAVSADWSGSLYQFLTNQPGKDAWPVIGATYAVVRARPNDAHRTEATLKFFDWALLHGQASSDALDYSRLPNSAIEKIRSQWRSNAGNDVAHAPIAGQ